MLKSKGNVSAYPRSLKLESLRLFKLYRQLISILSAYANLTCLRQDFLTRNSDGIDGDEFKEA